jgi:hypothetical protein
VGWDVGGFDAVATCCKVVFSKMDLSLDDGKLIAEVAQSVVLSTVTLDFGSSIPIIEVGNSTMESVVGGGGAIEQSVVGGGGAIEQSVVGGGGAIEQSVEPDRERLGDVLR